VVPDGPGKQNGFLGDNADQAPELGKPVFPDVVAEQRNLPGSGIVKAGDQNDQGRFAAARTTDDADGLAGGCVQGNVFQAGRTRTVVGKADAVERHSGSGSIGGQVRGSGIRHGTGGVQDFGHTQGAGNGTGSNDDKVGNPQQVEQD